MVIHHCLMSAESPINIIHRYSIVYCLHLSCNMLPNLCPQHVKLGFQLLFCSCQVAIIMSVDLKCDLEYLINCYCIRADALKEMVFESYEECEACLATADKEQVLYFIRFLSMRYTIGIESGSLDVHAATRVVQLACRKLNGFRLGLFQHLADFKIRQQLGIPLYEKIMGMSRMRR